MRRAGLSKEGWGSGMGVGAQAGNIRPQQQTEVLGSQESGLRARPWKPVRG